MKRNRIVALFLALAMMLSTCVAAAPMGEMCLPGTIEKTEVSIHNTVYFRTGMTTGELSSAETVYVEAADLAAISGQAKDIVDAGAMLYINAPQCSAEEVADQLSIPQSGTIAYKNELLVAYSVYKVGSSYVFACHYVIFAVDNMEDAEEIVGKGTEHLPETILKEDERSFSNVKLMPPVAEQTFGVPKVQWPEIVAAAVQSKKDTAEVVQTVFGGGDGMAPCGIELPDVNADKIWTETLSIYDNNQKYYGYLQCATYAYDLGKHIVNDKSQNVYDVVGYVKAYPQPDYTVREYTLRLHCNIVGHTCIGTTTVPSGISYSANVTLNPGANGGISVGTGMTWSYNPESQVIVESSDMPSVVDWTATTVMPTKGKAYDLTAGMRIACEGTTRGAFADFYCDKIFRGVTLKTSVIEVGGWF